MGNEFSLTIKQPLKRSGHEEPCPECGEMEVYVARTSEHSLIRVYCASCEWNSPVYNYVGDEKSPFQSFVDSKHCVLKKDKIFLDRRELRHNVDFSRINSDD